MSLDEITAALDEIRRVSWDDESAHVKQDALYGQVLEAIAAGAADPAVLAAEALKVRKIEFARWCA